MAAEEELVNIVIGAIAASLFFDFVNGFHDSANAIATVVGTRVLKPLHAVSNSCSKFHRSICIWYCYSSYCR
jgi:hypothetical protein